MRIDLTGKVAFVTGASRGIGKAIALALAKSGAKLALVATKQDLLDAVAKEAGGAKTFALDVANSAALEAAVDAAAKELGSVDILVNNAGITRDGLVMRMKEDDWTRVMDVNLKSAFSASKAAVRHMMRARWGRIINVSSVSGITGNPGQANYAAAKAGLIGLTKTLAAEIASRNITVNALAPGFIETDMTAGLDEKVKAAAVDQIPLKRFGKADDIAAAALFLASDAASYITGHTLVVDGGLTLG